MSVARAETERRILAAIATGDPWKHRNRIIEESGRASSTVQRHLRDMWHRNLIVHDEGNIDDGRTYWEWWRLSEAGKREVVS